MQHPSSRHSIVVPACPWGGLQSAGGGLRGEGIGLGAALPTAKAGGMVDADSAPWGRSSRGVLPLCLQPPPSPTLSSLGPLHPNPGPLSTALPERKGPLIPSISKQMGPWGKGGGGWGGGAQRAGAMRSLRCPLSTQFCANSVKSRAQRSSAEPPPLQVPGGVTHTAQPFCCATTNGAPSCSFPEPPRSKTPTPGASSTQRIRPSRTACTAFRRTMPTRGVLGVGQSSARSCLQTANPVGRYLFALWPPARC